MGEIGFPRSEFLYELRLWEIRAVVRGYRQRARTAWESARMNAFFVMGATADLRKAGIHTPSDLVRFPWEEGHGGGGRAPTAAEAAELRELMRRENEEARRRAGKVVGDPADDEGAHHI